MDYFREAIREIALFAKSRPAFVELTTGPRLRRRLHLGANALAVPLGSLGNEANVQFGIRVLRELGVPTDQNFVSTAKKEGRPFNDLVLAVYLGLTQDEIERAAWGSSQIINRQRALLSLFVGGEHRPIMMFNWSEQKMGSSRFLPPNYRGIPNRAADDPISPQFISFCATERQDDSQLHYYISIIEQIHAMRDEDFKIARYYSLLEAMSGSIKSQFEQQSGHPATRAAVRFLTGYFIEFDVPRFTIENGADFEFDHIELAGRIRDKLFHGGGTLAEDDVTVPLRPGVPSRSWLEMRVA